jgi:hypothetical protein
MMDSSTGRRRFVFPHHFIAVCIAALMLLVVVPSVVPAQHVSQSGIRAAVSTAEPQETLGYDGGENSAWPYVLGGAAIGAAVGATASLILLRQELRKNQENFYGPVIYLIPPVLGAVIGAGIGALVHCCHVSRRPPSSQARFMER